MGRLKKILVIDDEPRIRALFCRQLRETGYRTIEAQDGQEALQLLRKAKNIDLVILDLLLPNVSGLDIFEAIKRQFPQTKVVVSSVYSKDEQEFFIWSADDYYYKADSISVLIDKINKLLLQ